MNIRRLELFVAVAEELHFGRAAARLHMAQPPLSQQIRKLEEECKEPLFVRNSRNVELTAHGILLLGHARRLLAQHERMLIELKHARDGDFGSLRVGFVSSAAISTVPEAVRRIRARSPRIDLDLREMTTDEQLEALQWGRIDIGIARDVRGDDRICVIPLDDEPLIVAVPSDHRLANRVEIDLGELAGEEFVAFPRGRISRLSARISGLLDAADVEFTIAQEAVQFSTILGLVAAHLGVAVVPETMRALRISGLSYVNLMNSGATSRVNLIYSVEMADSPIVRHVRDLCLQLADEMSAHRARSDQGIAAADGSAVG